MLYSKPKPTTNVSIAKRLCEYGDWRMAKYTSAEIKGFLVVVMM